MYEKYKYFRIVDCNDKVVFVSKKFSDIVLNYEFFQSQHDYNVRVFGVCKFSYFAEEIKYFPYCNHVCKNWSDEFCICMLSDIDVPGHCPKIISDNI